MSDFLEELCHAGHIYSKDPAKFAEQKRKEAIYNHQYYMNHRYLYKKPKKESLKTVNLILQSNSAEMVEKAAKSPNLYNQMKEKILARIKKEYPKDYDYCKDDDLYLGYFVSDTYGNQGKSIIVDEGMFQLGAEITRRYFRQQTFNAVTGAVVETAMNKWSGQ